MKPFKFLENRVRRSYIGGSGIDRMRGLRNPQDGEYPEEWIASCVRAASREGEPADAGLSRIALKGGMAFDRCLEENSDALLGRKHSEKFGSSTGFLMKLLDSSIRLPVQAHPDKAKALALFNSPYGKNEAWHILATRRVDGEDPYILLGFNKKLDERVFSRESIRGRLDRGLSMLHRIVVKPGDTYMIPGGVPHAIGPGLTVIEIMEPTDHIVISEKFCGNIEISDVRRFNGLEPRQAMSMYDFNACTRDTILEICHHEPEDIDGSLTSLLDRKSVRYFGLQRLDVAGGYTLKNVEKCCRAGIVVAGRSVIDGALELRAGDTFFLPAGKNEYCFSEDGQIILALPPVP